MNESNRNREVASWDEILVAIIVFGVILYLIFLR